MQDINKGGLAVGCEVDALGRNSRPFWVQFNVADQSTPAVTGYVSIPGDGLGQAWAVNSSGIIVGDTYTEGNAFVAYPSGSHPPSYIAQDLDSVVGSDEDVVDFMRAHDINERGDIAGDCIIGGREGADTVVGYILERVTVRVSPVLGLILQLLGGVEVGGSGIAFPRGLGTPFPIGPSGPVRGWGELSVTEREVLAGLGAVNLAELFSNPEIRQQIQRAGLEAASAAIGNLQRKLAAPRPLARASKRARIERQPISPARKEGTKDRAGI